MANHRFKISPGKLLWYLVVAAMALSLVSTPILIIVSILTPNSAA